MLKQNYEIMNDLGFESIRGVIRDQETGDPIRYLNGKIFVENEEDANYRTYEYFNPYLNFKQLKYLTEFYLHKLEIEEGRYFYTLSPVQYREYPDYISIEAKGVRDEYDIYGNLNKVPDCVSSRLFPKDKLYLCYIDFICQLSGNTLEDIDLFLEGRE